MFTTFLRRPIRLRYVSRSTDFLMAVSANSELSFNIRVSLSQVFSTCVAPLGCQSIRKFGPPRQNSELGPRDRAYPFCSHFAIFARSHPEGVVIAKSSVLRSHWQSTLGFPCLWLNPHETFLRYLPVFASRNDGSKADGNPANPMMRLQGCPLVFLLFWLLASSLECNRNKI